MALQAAALAVGQSSNQPKQPQQPVKKQQQKKVQVCVCVYLFICVCVCLFVCVPCMFQCLTMKAIVSVNHQVDEDPLFIVHIACPLASPWRESKGSI